MNEDGSFTRRRRRRVRSWKKWRTTLLALGAGALFLGLGLFAASRLLLMRQGSRLRGLGLAYIAIGAGLIVLRGMLMVVDRIRKRKYRSH